MSSTLLAPGSIDIPLGGRSVARASASRVGRPGCPDFATLAAMSDTFTIDGRTLSMPVEVRAARSWLATYIVAAGAAQRLLPAGLDVAEVRPGKALVPLGFVRYADTDLGAYDE